MGYVIGLPDRSDGADSGVPQPFGVDMSQILPKSFAQRGCAVAFSTPILAFARCRRPPGEPAVEYLVPGLAGSTDIYVLPYKALPEIVALTVFDRALHEEMPKIKRITPQNIRMAILKTGRSGLAGPKLMKLARAAEEAEKSLPTAIMVSMVHKAIQQLAAKEAEAAGLDEAKLGTPDGLALARKALSNYAQSAGITAADIFSRLEDWGRLTALLGGAKGRHPGPLMDTIVATENLAAAMTKWLIPEPPETAEMAQRTALAAREACTIARDAVSTLDDLADDLNGALNSWQNTRGMITQSVDQVANVIDGWQRIVDYWESVDEADRFRQRNKLESFAQYLPILPEESVGDGADMWTKLRESQTRWNKSSQVKLSADLGQDAREKLSQFRKEAV